MVSGTGKHQQAGSHQNENQETSCQNQRRIGAFAQQTDYDARQLRKRKQDENSSLVVIVMKKHPHPIHPRVLFRLLEHHGQQGQVEQNGKNPGPGRELKRRVFLTEHNLQRGSTQKENPDCMIHRMHHLVTGSRKAEPVFIYDGQQENHAAQEINPHHPVKQLVYTRHKQFLII